MELLNKIKVDNKKTIELYQGDLTKIPEKYHTDLLIVSAFPNDYIPTRSSLIGALHQSGISVSGLAQNKESDLRDNFNCWMSKPINKLNINRILCFEPKNREDPLALISGIFQSILPFAFNDKGIKIITMPLLTAGDQGYSATYVLKNLLNSSMFWLQNGVPFDCIRIVVHSRYEAEESKQIFAEFKKENFQKQIADFEYDFFISYSHLNAKEADFVENGIKGVNSNIRIYRDRNEISIGDFWQKSIYSAVEKSKFILSLLSPNYMTSQMCIEEYNIGRARNLKENRNVVLPIYLFSSNLPMYMEAIQYFDAREGEYTKIIKACKEIITHANNV